MNHFSWKSLTFYGVAISSVVILFKLVTAYGESSLQAPPSIAGRYRLQSNTLPQCLQAETVFLTLQQSGIYLNGTLSPEKDLAAAEENLSLSGEFHHPSLSLAGEVPSAIACSPAENQEKNLVTLQAIWDNNSLKGQMNLNSTQEVINFIAQQEQAEKSSKPEH